MGGNSPSHLPDESKGRGVTLVKGIRLSDNVINRMKLSSKGSTPPVPSDSQTPEPTPPPSPVESLPPPVPQTASQPPIARLVPPPVKFHSLPPSSPVEPAEAQTCPFVSSARSETPAVPEPPVPVVEPVTPTHSKLETQTPAPALEQTADLLSRSPVEVPALSEPSSQTPAVTIRPAATAEPLESAAPSASLSPSLDSALLPSAPSDAPCAAPPAVVTEVPSVLEPPAEPASHLPAPIEETSSSCHDEPSAVPTEESASPPLPDPSLPTGESTMSTDVPPQDEEEETFTPVSSPTAALPISPEVVEEELRQKIRAEMENDLQQELNQRRLELERQLEEARARAEAEAKATCRAQVEEQVKKTLEEEKAAYVEKLTESIAKERVKSEDEKLMAQLYWMELKARQLDEKEKQLKKRDELRKEQVAKLEAKCAQFYKVSAESFQKGKEETERRFLRFNIQPVCGDLQSQILKCYKENTGKTLMCSSIASAYMQCVNKAKKDKLIPGG